MKSPASRTRSADRSGTGTCGSVFVRGFENQLAHKRWADENGWSEWRDLGGQLTSAPAVASWGVNRLDVFARGQDDHLLHKRWNGAESSEWRDLDRD